MNAGLVKTPGDLYFLKEEDVGLHQPRVHQVLHHRDAQALDVHGVPAGEVGQIAQQLSLIHI